MTQHLLISLLMSAGLVISWGATSHAHHEGCLITGQTAGPDESSCSYVAETESQIVLVGTPNLWEISVIRPNCPVWEFGCTPVLVDGCQPAPENTCQQFRNKNGELVYENKKVILLEGDGLTDGPLHEVHPIPGERVFVTILRSFLGDDWPGAMGFIYVTGTEGHL